MKQKSKNRPIIDFQERLQHKPMRKGKYFQQMVLEQLDIYMKKKAFGIYFGRLCNCIIISVLSIILTFFILMFPQSSSCFKDK